jgi:hypothetical protein
MIDKLANTMRDKSLFEPSTKVEISREAMRELINT